MAYVGHSSFRDVARAGSPTGAFLIVRCGLMGAAVVVVAILGAGGTPVVVPETAAAAKGDRIAAPRTAALAGPTVYDHDVAQRITTVSRGAELQLSPDSPMRAGLQ